VTEQILFDLAERTLGAVLEAAEAMLGPGVAFAEADAIEAADEATAEEQSEAAAE